MGKSLSYRHETFRTDGQLLCDYAVKGWHWSAGQGFLRLINTIGLWANGSCCMTVWMRPTSLFLYVVFRVHGCKQEYCHCLQPCFLLTGGTTDYKCYQQCCNGRSMLTTSTVWRESRTGGRNNTWKCARIPKVEAQIPKLRIKLGAGGWKWCHRIPDGRTDAGKQHVFGNSQDGFIHIAASGWISVNTEEKKNKHYIQKVKNQ